MTTSTRTPLRTRRESLESPVRSTAPAGFGGRLHGPTVQPTPHLLRHGAMPALFRGIRAPSTPGVVPAVVHLGERAAAEQGPPAGPGGAGRPRPAAARQGCAGL